MLPGFRFLFATIVLSMSMMVFGLGAAALLRAAHEEFANNPSWHTTPEPMFAQKNEATRPVLAMLRVEPLPAEQKAPDNAPEVVPAIAEPAAIAPPPAELEQIALLKPEETPPPASAKPDIPVSESPAQSEAAPAQTDAPAAADATKSPTSVTADETKIASTEQAAAGQVLPPANEAAPAASEPTSATASPEADTASTKIATLGGPSVTTETTPPEKAISEKPDRSAIKKRLQARRAAHRRRMAARARLARLAPQQPADPFAAQTIAQPVATVHSR
jgi:hypothetical protein